MHHPSPYVSYMCNSTFMLCAGRTGMHGRPITSTLKCVPGRPLKNIVRCRLLFRHLNQFFGKGKFELEHKRHTFSLVMNSHLFLTTDFLGKNHNTFLVQGA
jgi:hypothetical protein